MSQCAVYAIAMNPGPCKIGLTTSPKRRLSTLNVGLPHAVDIVHLRWLPNTETARIVEAGAHERLKGSRLRGEWFDCSPEEAIAAIDQAEVAGPAPRSFNRQNNARINVADGLHVCFDDSAAEKIDVWRMANGRALSRKEAVRLLINLALARNPPASRGFEAHQDDEKLELSIDDFRADRFIHPGIIPSKSEAIRRLVEKGLSE